MLAQLVKLRKAEKCNQGPERYRSSNFTVNTSHLITTFSCSFCPFPAKLRVWLAAIPLNHHLTQQCLLLRVPFHSFLVSFIEPSGYTAIDETWRLEINRGTKILSSRTRDTSFRKPCITSKSNYTMLRPERGSKIFHLQSKASSHRELKACSKWWVSEACHLFTASLTTSRSGRKVCMPSSLGA